MKGRGRIEGFDLLRGLCALGVVCYHLLAWFGSARLYTFGLYGVYVFFILSGASLYVAYADKISGGYSLAKYMALRLFRLMPLYFLAVLFTQYVERRPFDVGFIKSTLLNLTFAFGLANPGQTSLVTGGWSLGIEFVFYLVFPVVLSVTRNWLSCIAALVVTFACQWVFINGQLSSEGALINNWQTYTQFLSFAFYFMAGCIIGKLFLSFDWRPFMLHHIGVIWVLFALLIAGIGFGSGLTAEATLTGVRGAALIVLCVLIVFISGLLHINRRFSIVAIALGNMSYGVYLLHPILHTLVAKLAPDLRSNIGAYIVGIVVLTVVVALMVERFYERPIRNLGKRLLSSQGTAI